MRYPRGVTSFIPAYQPYQPDFTMMGKMLSIRQNQYDQNWKKLNDVYGSLLYADTTHEQSQVIKDQLKNEIDFNLRRISGLDLSLEKNVSAAQQVFQPFYENTNLMYDMAATKNVNSARSKADSYKNSADPKASGLYWDTGMDEINYRVQEFKETPYDQIASTGLAQVQYTPYFNVQKQALELAKDFGDMTTPSSDGKYDYETTNGRQIQGYLKALFEINIGRDPRAQAMYRTQAYVDRKNYMNSEAGKFGGDKNAAERAYLEESYRVLTGTVVKKKQSAEANAEGLKKQADILNSNTNYVEGQDKAMQNISQKSQVANETLNDAKTAEEMVSQGSSTSTTSTGQQDPFENIDVLRRKVDFLKAQSLMGKDLGESAQVLSYRNYKQTVKLNEEYKMALEQQYKMNLEFAKNAVANGTHRAVKDANGNVSLEPIKSANSWSQKLERDQAAGETDQGEIYKQLQSNDYKEIKSYMDEGIQIIQDLGIAQETGVMGDVFEALSPRVKDKIKSVEDLENATASYDAFLKSGLTYTDINSINNSIKDIVFNNDDYATLVDAKYGQTGNERNRINDWHNRSIKANNKIKVGILRNNWFKKTVNDLAKNAPKNSPLRYISFALDADGNEKDKKGYARAVAEAQMNTDLQELFKNMDLDAAKEADIRKKAAQAWDENGFFDADFWTKSVIPYMDATFNTYKLRDGEWFNYFNPFDWGKYTLRTYVNKKLSMPDYEDVLEAYHDAMKNSDRFIGNKMPGSRGVGTGQAGMSSYAVVVEGASNTKPYQDFYGGANTRISIADDARSIMAQGPANVIYSAFGTTKNAMVDEEGKPIEDDINTEAHQEAVKKLWEYAIEETNNEGMGNMDVTIKPVTQFDGTKGGYTIKFGKKFLEEFIQKADSDGNLTSIGMADGNVLNDIFANGATIITAKSNMNSDPWEAGNVDDIAASLQYKFGMNAIENPSQPETATETFNLGNGYSAKFQMYGTTSNPSYRMVADYKLFDLNHFIKTGETSKESTEVHDLPAKSLTKELDIFMKESVGYIKQSNSTQIAQVSALIKAMRKKNPNISDEELYEALIKMGYGTTEQ